MSDVFHLNLTRGQVAGASLAILPGDPGRVPKLAELLDDHEPLASNREFTSYRGTLDGRAVIVCSTGIGGPSVSIATEELAQLGVRTFLRAGTTGAIHSGIGIADVIVTTGAVRLDGASQHFAPLEYPAVADHECTTALVDAARAVGVPVHVGITASADTFYPGQERYDTVSGFVNRQFRGSRDEWQALNVLNYEMESATLFTMCATNGWRAGMVSGVLVNRTQQETPGAEVHDRVEANAVRVAIEGARRLLAANE